MGIIQQQTIKGSLYSYLGIMVGFVSFYLIQPHAISEEEIGLTAILTNYSLMFAQFAMLGFNGTNRYFPYFRNEEKKHHGYLFLSCVVAAIGIVVFVVLAWLFKEQIISQKAQKTLLFSQYYWYLVPLTLATLFFNVFNLYARMLYNVITGTILNEFVKRSLVLIPLLLIFFKLIDFKMFMILWLVANIIPTLLMVLNLVKNNQFHLKPDLAFLDKDMVKKLVNISLFAILTGYSPLIIQNLDTYFVNKIYGLGNAGVYNIAFYFATIISVPTRSLYSIAFTIVAEAWKNNDMAKIGELYKKSCINQLISSLFLFILIWANQDHIFYLLPPVYSAGKYVLFFIGIGYIIDSATGINSILIGTSKYYRYDSFFYVLLVGVTIVSNIVLIPIYGITGAALAYAITIGIFNLGRYLFILFVFKMQPFGIKNLLTILLGLAVYFVVNWCLPSNMNWVLNGFLRCALITVLFGSGVYFSQLSEDINRVIDKYLAMAGLKK
jgi:O-antigen/teichoic acid export membrane protein